MLRSVDVHDHPGREVVAGITVAAVAVPGVIGYAHIAGMPIATGLYTMIIPATVFVILCSSRHLVVGADSTTAAILAAGLTPLAAVGCWGVVAACAIGFDAGFAFADSRLTTPTNSSRRLSTLLP